MCSPAAQYSPRSLLVAKSLLLPKTPPVPTPLLPKVPDTYGRGSAGFDPALPWPGLGMLCTPGAGPTPKGARARSSGRPARCLSLSPARVYVADGAGELRDALGLPIPTHPVPTGQGWIP